MAEHILRSSRYLGRDTHADLRFLISIQGDSDLTIPFTSVKAVARAIQWHRQREFMDLANCGETRYTPLTCNSALCNPPQPPYGNTIQVGNLKYARIYHAGHMPMERRGPELLDLFNTWMAQAGVPPNPPPPPPVDCNGGTIH